jgi:hypothetical protein
MLEKLITRLNELNQDEWDFDGWSSKDILIFAHQTICDEFNKDYDDEQFETLFHQAWNVI